MSIIEKALGEIDGNRILDIATQQGHFTQILTNNLKSYTEIVGIDTNQVAIRSAQDKFGREHVRFLVMDAEWLSFGDASFDTVTISASLHHLTNIPRVLKEMLRVLKPGGYFILVEMHRDAQTEAALTSVYLHAWVAEVDTALGIKHNKTLSIQQFKSHIADLELHKTTYQYENDSRSDPKEKNKIAQLDNLIERTMLRAKSATNHHELLARGNELQKRLIRIGAQREPVILIIGVK
jgi:ubiquinone/menaquinone biosynthesis C-methylase UbiE